MRLFCPPDSPKRKDIHFMVEWEKEKQQILTFEKLELKIFLSFLLEELIRNGYQTALKISK